MPTESDLRDLLRDEGPGTGGIDLDAVLRRSRARRRPRVAAAAAIGSLAIVGVGLPVGVGVSITASGGGTPTAILAGEDTSDEALPEAGTGPVPEDGSFLAGAPEVTFVPADPPWRIEVLGSTLAGDPAPCTTDAAVATSQFDGDGVPVAVELVVGAGRADAARVAECLAGVLTGGAITASGQE